MRRLDLRRGDASAWRARDAERELLSQGLADDVIDRAAMAATSGLNPHGAAEENRSPYFVSLWEVCLRQKGQNLLISSRSVVFFLFFVVA